ncbi:peptidyl-prolyl cis-trans isomerase C [Albidovulum inexpectatum]|uniref:Parvulin-like PPIase n=1 Tax=Albidovulum inexpectatum TaxID=196587 RepID=A0A2S5JF21_9RHOB|nr:peptidylprolyl isomerase [Albidovulum inexpectatum]PPB79958.1 peptidyl-prolyl cis-trans isomerase C [Albidovulum inexpectatum]
MTKALFPDVIVNGHRIPHARIAAEAQNHPAPRGKPGMAWRKAANALAIRALLLQEARRQGLSADPAEIAPGRFETEEEALIRGLLDKEISMQPPSDDEVRAEWARDPSRFRSPPLWEVSHILIACDPRDAKASQAAHARAVELCAAVLADPGSFARVAARHSDCPSRSSGGSLGQIRPGDTVPEFESILRALRPGEITREPRQTRHGWHVVRMDAIAEGAVLPFQAVRPRIRDAMEKAAWTRAARQFIGRLVVQADIRGADIATELTDAENPA